MVNYFRDMWKRRSHLVLAPLTQLVSKSEPFNWTSVHKEAYVEVKRVISKEALLSFPDFNKPFHFYTDESNYQLGSVTMQDDKPLAFYSRTLNPAQKRYTTREQELLSNVETLKEFRTLLYGQRVVVYTDHKNILYGNLVNNRIARW
jgi:RNase H-like domain found in reverse transcriptase